MKRANARIFGAVAAASLLLILTSCDGDVAAAPSFDKSPDIPSSVPAATLVTGKTAYWEVYKKARQWAADIVPLSLSINKAQPPGLAPNTGKAAIWSMAFASPSKHQVRMFTYATVAAGEIPKGVEAGKPMPWTGSSRDAMPFSMMGLSIDSDAAYNIAWKKGEAWLKQHPNVALTTMTLGAETRFPAPVWYLLWGNNKAGFNTWVDASTGAPVDHH